MATKCRNYDGYAEWNDHEREVDGLEEELAEARAQLAEKEVFTCPQCKHLFPYQNLGVPCPHCCIEELEAKIEKIRALNDRHYLAGTPRWKEIREILGDEEGT